MALAQRYARERAERRRARLQAKRDATALRREQKRQQKELDAELRKQLAAQKRAEKEQRRIERRERHAARRAWIAEERERRRLEVENAIHWQPTAEELAAVPAPKVPMLEADWVNEQMRMLRQDRRYKAVRWGLKLTARTPIREVMEKYGIVFTQLPTASAATLTEIIQEAMDRERKQRVSEVRRELMRKRKERETNAG